ncbi:hypothetical protein Tco_0058158 [Tanacetum coccineum]
MLFPHKRTFPTPALIQKLFSNMKRASKGYSGVDILLFLTMLTTPESSPSRITSSPSLSHQTHSSTSQLPSTPPSNQTTPVIEEAAPMPHESPLQSVHSLRRDEGSLSLNELTDLYTSLSKKVESLESELKQTKHTYNVALTKLIKRVKKLEQTIKTSQARRRAKVVIYDDKEAEEDPSNQGRSLIEELDLDARISLVPPHAADQGRFNESQISDQPEEQLGVFSAATALADAARRRRSVENVQTYTRRREVSTGSGGVSTASRLVSTTDISTASVLDSTVGVKAKDKGKAIMHESEPPKKIKKRVQVQMSVNEELAKKVFEEEQARFNAEQEARFKAEQEQERIDFETALELQKQLDEREEVAAKVDQAHDINWSDPVVLRYHTLQNRPFSVAKIEKEVMKRSGFDHQQESSKPVEEEMVQQDDVIAEQAVKESSRTAGGRRNKSLARKRARETLSEESAKKWKLEDDTEKEELQVYLNIVPEDESLDVESLATKQDVLELYRLVKDKILDSKSRSYVLLMDTGLGDSHDGRKEISSAQDILSNMLSLKARRRVVDRSYLENQPNLRPTFAAIGFDCLLDINEKICPIFVLQFYKSVRLIRNLNGTLSIAFIIQNVKITLQLEEFSRILHIPYRRVCVFTPEWATTSLPNGIDSNPDIYQPPLKDPLLIRDALFDPRPPGKTRKVKGIDVTLDPFLNGHFRTKI